MFNISKLVYFLIKEHFRKLTKFISVTVNEKLFVIQESFRIIRYNVYVDSLNLSAVGRGYYLDDRLVIHADTMGVALLGVYGYE